MTAVRTAVRTGAVTLFAAAALTACTDVVNGHPTLASAPTRAELSKVVLSQSDMTTGWTPLTKTSTSNDPDLESNLASCLNVRFDDSLKVATVHSSDFHNDTDQVSSAAASFKTQAEADSRIAAVNKPGAGECFAAALRQGLGGGLPKDTTVSDVSVRVLSGGIVTGVAATVHAVITFSALSQSARIWLDVAYIKARQSIVTISFTGVSGQVAADVQSTFTGAVLKRAREV